MHLDSFDCILGQGSTPITQGQHVQHIQKCIYALHLGSCCRRAHMVFGHHSPLWVACIADTWKLSLPLPRNEVQGLNLVIWLLCHLLQCQQVTPQCHSTMVSRYQWCDVSAMLIAVRAGSTQGPKWTEEDTGAEADSNGAYGNDTTIRHGRPGVRTDLGGGLGSMSRGPMEWWSEQETGDGLSSLKSINQLEN